MIEHQEHLIRILAERIAGEALSLRGTTIPGANLRLVNFEGLDLSQSDFAGAHFGRANMRGATLEGVNLEGSDLANASLQGAVFGEANLQDAMFEDADLQGASLRYVNARRCFFENANLEQADFHGADLREADFAGANFRGSILEQANLEGAQLDGADLQGAVLVNAVFRNASLRGANLQQIVLRGTSFEGADLNDARLQGLDFSSSDMTGVHLAGARLEKTQLSRAQIGGALGEELAHDYRGAARGYFALERNFSELGDQDAARWAYGKRRRMQKHDVRQRAVAERKAGNWRSAARLYASYANDQFVEWLCDYGESVPRVFAALLVVYVFFTLLYGVTGSVVRMQGALRNPVITRAPIDLAVFSLLALTTSGSPGIGVQPRGEFVYFLSGAQALIGISITGLLGFVIGNRIRR